MSEYLERETVVNIADHAILEHPYDKDSQRPEEYSDYNQGWSCLLYTSDAADE